VLAEKMARLGGRINCNKGLPGGTPTRALSAAGVAFVSIPRTADAGAQARMEGCLRAGLEIALVTADPQALLADPDQIPGVKFVGQGISAKGQGPAKAEKKAAPPPPAPAPTQPKAAPATTPARRAEPVRPASPARAAAQPARLEPARPEPAKPAEAAKPAEKFRLIRGQKIQRAVNIALAAIAIGAAFAPLSVPVMLAITAISGGLAIISSLILSFSIGDSKLNFKGVGIVGISDKEFTPEAAAAVRQGLVALRLGRGINAVFVRGSGGPWGTPDHWEIHKPEEQKAVEKLLLKHVSKPDRIRSDLSIMFEVTEENGRMNVVFSLTYTDLGWNRQQKTLLTLKQLSPY
jgi:hypothetical protein